MSVFGFLYHLLIFVIGVLVSILLALVLIYIFTSNASKDQSDPLLFLSEPEKSTILTLPIDSPSAQGIWMFGSLVTQRRSASQVHVQAVYVKLADQYLLLHLISKRMKHLHQKTPIAFSQVHIFDLKQGKIALKPVEQHRTKYWWKKTPLVLSQLRHLACYQILRNKQRKKKDPSDDGQTTFSEYLRPMTLPWVTKKDEIHLYAFTNRSKEEWFYRLTNATKSTGNTDQSFSRSIETEYLPTTCPSKITDQKTGCIPSVWPTLIRSFLDRLFPTDPSKNDYLTVINQMIYRCTRNFEENFQLRNYFRRKIQQKLKHLKLPSYTQWIRLSNMHFDNTYPTVENVRRIWCTEQGLWSAIDLTYQGNISFEFTIKINFMDRTTSPVQNMMIIQNWIKRWLTLSDNLQVLTKIVDTMLVITIHIRRIRGVLLMNIPLPPSDRLWFAFEDMPLMDFDVHHLQVSPHQSRSSSPDSLLSVPLSEDLNQLQTTINRLLSHWIEKQFRKEYVLPNMRDVVMKWCSNPLAIHEQTNRLELVPSYQRNHLLWYDDADCQTGPNPSSKKIYLIAQWKRKARSPNFPKPNLALPSRSLLTDTYLLVERAYRSSI